jgi:hypothetical protein
MSIASRELGRARTLALRARRARLLGLNIHDDDDDPCGGLDYYMDGGLRCAMQQAEERASFGSSNGLNAIFGAPGNSRSRASLAARRLLLSTLLNDDE